MTDVRSSRLSRALLLRMALLLAASIAVLLALLLPQQENMARWLDHWGFYGIAGSFGLWLLSLVPRVFRPGDVCATVRRHAPAAALCLALTVAAFLVSPPKFRILNDETNLVGVAMAMYEQAEVWMPFNGLIFADSYQDLTHTFEKRPFTWPFCLFIIHSLLGYDGDNGFVLNFLACFGSLFFFHVLLRRWFSATTATLGVLFLACYPLFVIYATSSGFEVLNVCLVIMAFLFLDRHTRAPSSQELERLTATLLLLAQCRYESVVFLLALLPVALLVTPRTELERVSPLLALFPVLLTPMAWQRVLYSSPWKFKIGEVTHMFSTGYLLDNLAYAWRFFKGVHQEYATVPIVLYLALAGALLAVCTLLWRARGRDLHLKAMASAFVLSFLGVSAILFLYAFGNLTYRVSMRLGLIFLPVLAFFAVIPAHWLARRWSWVPTCGLALAVTLLVLYWPVAAKNAAITELHHYRIYNGVLDFLKTTYPNRDFLLVTDAPNQFVVHRMSSVYFPYARANLTPLVHMLRQGVFKDILVAQQIDNATGTSLPVSAMPADLPLQPVFTMPVEQTWSLRVSRIALAKTP